MLVVRGTNCSGIQGSTYTIYSQTLGVTIDLGDVCKTLDGDIFRDSHLCKTLGGDAFRDSRY